MTDRADLRACDTARAVPTGLLPWQGALLALPLGIFAIRHPLESFLCLIVLWLAWTGLGGRARTGLSMCLVFCLGLLLAWVHLPAVPEAPAFVDSGSKVRISGVVAEVDPKPARRLSVILQNVSCILEDGTVQGLPGNVSWAWHAPTNRPVVGQTVSLTARVDSMGGFANPGGWDYEFYQRTRSIFYRIYSRSDGKKLTLGPTPQHALAKWRAQLLASISAVTKSQGGAMLATLVAGDRFALSPETVELLRRAGLSHTLALSGLHLGFVVLFGFALAWTMGALCPALLLRIPRPKLAVLCAAPLVLAYLWLGRFSPSLVRASCMFAFWGFFLLQGRGRVLLDGLFWAVGLILLVSPLAVFDIRLQLSAVAVAGIALFFPVLMSWLPALWRPVRWAVGILGVSICATVSILPITAHVFGMFAPNVVLNLLWLPLLGFVVMPLGALGVVCFALPWGGEAASWSFSLGATVLEKMLAGLESIHALGALPMVQLLRPLWPEMLGAAVLLACMAVTLRGGRNWWPVVLGLFLLAAPHVYIMAQDAQDEVRLEVLDVGQGIAVVVSAPGGGRIIIDGGGLRSKTFDTGRDVVAPFLTLGRAPRLDAVLLTHPHADHYKGLLHLLEYFDVQMFRYSGSLPGGSYRKRFQRVLEGMDVARLYSGETLELADGLVLETLHPDAEYVAPTTNDISLVQRLVWHGRGLALLTGDAETPSLEHLLRRAGDVRAQVLVLPHHGSITSFVPLLYERVSPLVAFCSSGSRNRFIQPAPSIVEALHQNECSVFSTWQSGMLRMRWRPEKEPVVQTLRGISF